MVGVEIWRSRRFFGEVTYIQPGDCGKIVDCDHGGKNVDSYWDAGVHIALRCILGLE